jgi:hypothetical protein
MIEHLIHHIDEELEGAKDYAEKYIEWRAKGDMIRANKYKDMASDELRHASYVYEFAVQDADKITKIYTLPEETEEMWKKSKKHYAECMAKIKMMLA